MRYLLFVGVLAFLGWNVAVNGFDAIRAAQDRTMVLVIESTK